MFFDSEVLESNQHIKGLKTAYPAKRKRYRNVSIWLQKGLVELNIVETLLER